MKTVKERKNLETLRNYLAKAIWKTLDINSPDWRITKVNTELTKLISLVEEIMSE